MEEIQFKFTRNKTTSSFAESQAVPIKVSTRKGVDRMFAFDLRSGTMFDRVVVNQH